MAASKDIISTAKAHPDWRQARIAEYCGTTKACVKVVLCQARKSGKIAQREIDRQHQRRSSAIKWIPGMRMEQYLVLRRKVGAEEAKRMLREDMARSGENVSA